MKADTANIFAAIPEQILDELFDCIFQRESMRIERIVSKGHVTAAGQWYDQDWDEWVIVLQGQATLLYEPDRIIQLSAGDYLLIPAHTRHRVEWTPADINTVWLAVHVYK